MNDRYLYRAKRIFDGKWEEGFLTKINRQMHIVNQCGENTAHQIDESTICQCTGLNDKNGKLIFENDIVKVHDDEEPCLIEWGEDTARWNMTQYGSCVYDFDNYWSYEVEVIGSAIDNPELLE